jgi:hypothetical protein
VASPIAALGRADEARGMTLTTDNPKLDLRQLPHDQWLAALKNRYWSWVQRLLAKPR